MLFDPIILAPAPIVTLSPILGASVSELSFTPMVTSPKIWQLLPTLAFPLIAINPQ